MNYLDMIDPGDPMSVMVAADWLEESGRTTEANALRSLAPPITDNNYGYFDGRGDGSICNHGHGYRYGHGKGFVINYGYECGYGDGDYYGNGYNNGLGHGRGHGYDDSDNYAEFLNYVSQMRIFLKGELINPAWR